MTDATRASPEELLRREQRIRTYHRPRVLNDPFTWTYPWKAAGTMTALGLGAAQLLNVWQRKPWWYDAARRVPGIALCGVLGYLVGMGREYHYRTRDAVMDHYMELHPEDFVNTNDFYGRPYSDIILPWYPKRPQYIRWNLYVNEEDRVAVKPNKK